MQSCARLHCSKFKFDSQISIARLSDILHNFDFLKFYCRHYELVSKSNVGLKTFLHQGLSESEYYDDLVYKFKQIVGNINFSYQFRKQI